MSTAEFSGASKNIFGGRGTRFPTTVANQQSITVPSRKLRTSEFENDSLTGSEDHESTISWKNESTRSVTDTDGKRPRLIVNPYLPKGRGRFPTEMKVSPFNNILEAVKVAEAKETTEKAPVEQFLDAASDEKKKLDESLPKIAPRQQQCINVKKEEDAITAQRPVQPRKLDHEEPQVILRRRPNLDNGESPSRVPVATRVNLPGMGMTRGVDLDYLRLMDKNVNNIVDINESWSD